jgi:hypothetical protein
MQQKCTQYPSQTQYSKKIKQAYPTQTQQPQISHPQQSQLPSNQPPRPTQLTMLGSKSFPPI